MKKDLFYKRCNECQMAHRSIAPDQRCRCSIIENRKQPDDDYDSFLRWSMGQNLSWPSNVFLMKVP